MLGLYVTGFISLVDWLLTNIAGTVTDASIYIYGEISYSLIMYTIRL